MFLGFQPEKKFLKTFLFPKIDITKFGIGPKTNKKLARYQKYLSVRDRDYIDWAIYHMSNWKRTQVIYDVIHLHGDNDMVLPVKNSNDCIVLKGGTHVMIMFKGKWIFSEILNIIEN